MTEGRQDQVKALVEELSAKWSLPKGTASFRELPRGSEEHRARVEAARRELASRPPVELPQEDAA